MPRLLLAMLLAASLVSVAPDQAVAQAYTDESVAERDARMSWWRDARFGMFIHWGVYSVPAGAHNGVEYDRIGEWIMHTAKIPVAEYREYAKDFNPVKYDPEYWARLADEAGMKYMVITSKHHDGFALFPSEVTDWDIADASPYGKDLIGPLADAARRRGLRFGLYYSQAQDWVHPGGAKARFGLDGWDPAHAGDFDEYLADIAIPQTGEILDRYDPDVLWWDTPVNMNKERAKRFFPVIEKRPKLIVNNRLVRPSPKGDFDTPEQHIPDTGVDGDWETCMTMNRTWGYKSFDHEWKSTELLLRNLVDIASKGGNYLLNIGPKKDGTLPQESIDRLQEIGRWMKANGDSIYGTTASPVARPEWGRVTMKREPAGATLYLSVFDWPADGELTLPIDNDVVECRLLAEPSRAFDVKKVAGKGLSVQLTGGAPDPIASVVVLRIKGEPVQTSVTYAPRGADQRAVSNSKPYILTPPAPPEPRVNGPTVFGVRPGHPFLYKIPATGDRPMTYSAGDLPEGLELDPKTGLISGRLESPGEHVVSLRAKNQRGESEKRLRVIVGEDIALTPPLGWNSWNCWGPNVDAEKVLQSAQAMIDTGLIDHGWSYVNIDDAWQAPERGGPFNAIQGNDKFPHVQELCDRIHGMGLKVGIYSTPWVTSYAGHIGGSADNPNGDWTPPADRRDRLHGGYSFVENDAQQWAAWGIDYLKYDWNPKSSNPRESPEQFRRYVAAMGDALRHSGRDIVYSYSNSMPFDYIPEVSSELNCWRTTGDIHDSWWSIVSIGFSQDRWAPHGRPGHWNDADMLVVGAVDVGKGRDVRPTRLTADEQYTHVSLWSLLASPLLIGCDLAELDDFTLSLLTNDEVLAVNQDALGKQARLVSSTGGKTHVRRPGRDQQTSVPSRQVWARPLEDGAVAVGLFNLGEQPTEVGVEWSEIGVQGEQLVRDLWRQSDAGSYTNNFRALVPAHGVILVKLSPVD